MNTKTFAKQQARLYRKYGYDNHNSYQEVLRFLREEMPEVKKKRKGRKLPDIITEPELQHILKHAYLLQATKKDSARGLIVETLVKTGMRISELCNLRIENIDFNDNMFKIVQGKGSKDRYGLMPPSLVIKIINYIGNRKQGFVFLNNRGNKYLSRSIQLYMADIKQRTGINKNLTPHTLRHVFASFLSKNGVDIRKIQQLLGHENISTTEIYTHLDFSDMKQEVLNITNEIEQTKNDTKLIKDF